MTGFASLVEEPEGELRLRDLRRDPWAAAYFGCMLVWASIVGLWPVLASGLSPAFWGIGLAWAVGSLLVTTYLTDRRLREVNA